jgi:bifunctional NMN adenylyltransferase/nudix hydrolase
MIMSWYAEQADVGELRIQGLHDHPYNDGAWIKSVQDIVKSTIRDFWVHTPSLLTDVRLTGSDRDESTWYLNAFPQWKQALILEHHLDGMGQVNATAVRAMLFSADYTTRQYDHMRNMLPTATFDFLTNFIGSPEHEQLTREFRQNEAYRKAWSVAPYAPTFNTCDAVVIQSGHVLVVERGAEPGKGLWALPGGFLDQKERIQDGAIRELLEETGIRLAEGKNAKDLTIKMLRGSIRAKEIFDKPDRSSRGRTITVAYLFRLDDTKPLPKVKGQNAPLHETNGIPEVETAKAFWVPISEALNRTDMWFEDHHGIVSWSVGVIDS